MDAARARRRRERRHVPIEEMAVRRGGAQRRIEPDGVALLSLAAPERGPQRAKTAGGGIRGAGGAGSCSRIGATVEHDTVGADAGAGRKSVGTLWCQCFEPVNLRAGRGAPRARPTTSEWQLKTL